MGRANAGSALGRKDGQVDINSAKASGPILSLVGSGRARSRSALTYLSGLSRATVYQKLAGIIDAGLIRESEETLLSAEGKTARDVLGIGIGLPAPVDYANGRVAGPSVMAGWDNFEICQHLENKFGVPVYAEWVWDTRWPFIWCGSPSGYWARL